MLGVLAKVSITYIMQTLPENLLNLTQPTLTTPPLVTTIEPTLCLWLVCIPCESVDFLVQRDHVEGGQHQN